MSDQNQRSLPSVRMVMPSDSNNFQMPEIVTRQTRSETQIPLPDLRNSGNLTRGFNGSVRGSNGSQRSSTNLPQVLPAPMRNGSSLSSFPQIVSQPLGNDTFGSPNSQRGSQNSQRGSQNSQRGSQNSRRGSQNSRRGSPTNWDNNDEWGNTGNNDEWDDTGNNDEWGNAEFEELDEYNPSVFSGVTALKSSDLPKISETVQEERKKFVNEYREQQEQKLLQKLEDQFQREAEELERKIAREAQMERAELRRQQDEEYEEVLRLSKEADQKQREEQAREEEESAKKLSIQLQEEQELLRQENDRLVRALEETKRLEAIKPPVLKYDPAESAVGDVYHIKFRLPDNTVVNHSFDRSELFLNVVKQISFDLKTNDPLKFVIPIKQLINYDNTTTLEKTGLKNKGNVIVSYLEE